MNLGFIGRFFGMKKRKDRLLTSLNPDEESKQIKEAFKKIQSLEAQLSNVKVKEKNVDEEKKDFLDELSLVKELKKKSDIIENKKFKGHFEIESIHNYLRRYKKAKIEITDRDDTLVFDTFKTFVFLPNGNIGIKGISGEIWAYGSTLNHIIYKPESIKNHLKRKRIPIPYDSKHKPLPDLEKFMMRELKYYPEDDEFAESDELLRPVKEMIMDREKELHKRGEHIEYLEKLNSLNHRKIMKIQRDLNLLKEKAGMENSELSIAIDGMIQYAKQLGNTTRQNILLTDGKLTIDEIKERQDIVITKLLNEVEDKKSKTALRQAKDELQRDFQMADKFGKKTIINKTEEVEIPVQPGQALKS